VVEAIQLDAQAGFLTRGNRVVETDALNERAVPAVAFVGSHDAVEGALFCA
jgi:hypothetical protein